MIFLESEVSSALEPNNGIFLFSVFLFPFSKGNDKLNNANGGDWTAAERSNYDKVLRTAFSNILGEGYHVDSGANKIYYRDPTTGEEKEVYQNITRAEMEEAIKHQMALDEIGGQVKEIAEKIENEVKELESIGINRTKAIGLVDNGINGIWSLNNLNQEEIDKLF
jgi:hypothetical protein